MRLYHHSGGDEWVVDEMERAWQLGVSHFEIQVDSVAALALFQAEGPCEHQHANLVLTFQRLCKWSRLIRLRHVYREANHVADFLAGFDHSLDLGSHEIFLPLADLSRWLLFDTIGGGIQQAVKSFPILFSSLLKKKIVRCFSNFLLRLIFN
ncbi:Putative ribonuclease H protein At1g65750 [Linum grandiflorum]